MKKYVLICWILGLSACTQGQKQATPYLVGGPCEGCEAVLEFSEKELSSTDTLPIGNQEINLIISGQVMKADKTPVAGVVIYLYHTNADGIYPSKPGDMGWARRHGNLRTWVRSDADGRYQFSTIRPASYPGRNVPQHIHLTILEPNGRYYYIDEIEFEDDPLLPKSRLMAKNPRGGLGVIPLSEENEVYYGKRDIILGLNIPNYE